MDVKLLKDDVSRIVLRPEVNRLVHDGGVIVNSFISQPPLLILGEIILAKVEQIAIDVVSI